MAATTANTNGTDAITPQNSSDAWIKQANAILKFIMSKGDAEPFLEPVDWEALGIPDYPRIIKNPMDLGTIRSKLESHKYSNVEEFGEDVRLVWTNAKTFNQPGSGIYVVADTLSKAFERRYSKLKTTSEGTAKTSTSAVTGSNGSTGKRKRSTTGQSGKPVSQQDKMKFSGVINQLDNLQLAKIVEMIQTRCPEALNDEDEDDIEIEVDKIDKTTLTALITFAEGAIAGEASKKRK